MRFSPKLAVGTALLATTALSPLCSARENGLTLEEVAPGVWAALQRDAVRFNDSNSVVIVSDRDVIVVDSQSDPATAHALITDLRARTDKPVRYLVNTHFHSDHTRGNFVYREEFPGLEIIGHPTLMGAQIADAKNVLMRLESIEWALPSLTVSDSLNLNRSVGPIEIHAVPAHTRGDLVILLPEAGVLITGDVLDDLPFGGHGYPANWVRFLTELESWDWETLIPGHGRVREGPDARAHLANVRSLFELMIAAARESAEIQTDLETATKAFLGSADLARLKSELVADDAVAGKNFDRFVPATFERAFLESRGELPD